MRTNKWLWTATCYTLPSLPHILRHTDGPCGQILDDLTNPPLWSRGSQRSFCSCITSLAACTKSFHFGGSVSHRISILFQMFIHISLPLQSLRLFLFSSSNQWPCRDFRGWMEIIQFSVMSAVKTRRLNDTRGWPPPSSEDYNQPTLNLSVTRLQRPDPTEDHPKYR